jgi:PAS domain S-box-containing protein
VTMLSGYAFSTLREGKLTLYRGSGDGLAPILLVAPGEEQSAREPHRWLEQEYALRAELDPGWAARPLALTGHHNRLALVLEDPGGEPLERLLGRPLETTQFLHIAISLAAALRQVHERNVIHKDIKPANILVDLASGRVWLTGFGIASRLPREHQAPERPDVIAGTLAYMAPEQTGRMNRSVDSRSDLYALGVTLYEMLTGALPFTADDPMAWVHCHIARQPVPPSNRAPSIPVQISSIVMKLLAKTAEDRYQTAAGVVADLQRCLSEWETSRRINSFPLGSHDISDQLMIPERLYGREAEIGTLLAAFDRVVANGASELVLVSGYSGIGKSSLVNELHRKLVPPRGLFTAGKFDQYKRNIPYATLAEAFQNLVHQILGKSDAEMAQWRTALLEALGPNGQLMVNFIPELALIIGDQPEAPELALQDRQARFQLVFRRFLSVFARPEHPLALFVDDLQWLDSATLDLIEHLVLHPDVRHLLLIGAYRDNEVGPAHPLARTLARLRESGGRAQQIVLTPLIPDDVERLVVDTLHTDRGRMRSLADLVFEKTAGNPFFTIQFLSALAEEGLLTFDPDKAAWGWDLSRIRAKGFTDNVADLMATKLNRLPPPTQNALGQLACLGNVAEVATLALVHGEGEDAIHAALWEAVRAGFVIRADSNYSFAHDRIHEAAYALIAESERAPAHLRIGRLLAARTSAEALEDKIFDIVNQFDRATALSGTDDECKQVAALNLMAGKRAKVATAYAAALRYFATGRALLGDQGWARHYPLAFELELNHGECEYLTGDLAAAEARLSALSACAQTAIDAAAVACVRINLYTTLDRSDSAVDVGLEYLRRIDPLWPLNATAEDVQQEYDRLRQRMGSASIEALLDLPLMGDPGRRATMDVLTVLTSPALFTDLNLFRLVVGRMATLSLDHGNTDGSSLAYIWFGAVLGTHFGDYQAGFRFGRLGLDLVEKRGLGRFRARVYLVYAVHVAHWVQPLATSRDYLQRAFKAAKDAGDLTYAAYSRSDLTANLLASGNPLGEVGQEAEYAFEFVGKLRFGLINDIIASQHRLIRMLRGLTPEFNSFNDAEFDEGRFEHHLESNPQLALAAARYWIRKLQAHVFAADDPSAVAAARKTEMLLWTVPTQIELSEYHFYAALACAARCDTASAIERPHHFEMLAAHHKQITEWAKNGPETFANRAALVGAEIARLEARDTDAMRLYEEAIRLAREHGFIQNEGLGYELGARFYTAHGFDTIAHGYLRNARDCYIRWGADGKVRQLDTCYPGMAAEGRPRAETIDAAIQKLDVMAVLKASQAVSGEIELPKLIERLMIVALENAGADRGFLILPQKSDFLVAAMAEVGSGEIALRQVPLSSHAVPNSLIRYVTRTHESVILDDAIRPGLFAEDEYFIRQRPRSVFCLPLVRQTELVGVLYLENMLAPHVFTPDRTALLGLLASQIAISLENTRLYSDLREREAKIRRLVDANIIGIIVWDLDGRVLEANDAFLRIVGYDREDLVSGRLRWTDLTPPEWLDRDLEKWVPELRETGSLPSFEKEYFRKDGSRVPILIGVAMFEEGGTQGVAFVLDLTERKRAEEALRESQEKFRDYAETASDWFWEMDSKFMVLTGSGHQIGTNWWDRVLHRAFDVKTEPEKWRLLRATLDSQKPFRDFVYCRSDGSGAPIYVKASGKPVFDSHGEFHGYRGTATDVTEIVRAQEALRESERSSRSALDGIAGLVSVLAPNGELETANRQLLEYFGRSLEWIKNWGTNDAVHPEDLPRVVEFFERAIASGIPFNHELRLRRFDGEYRWFDNRGVPVRDASGRIARWYILLTDIEERTRALARLDQLQSDFAHMNRVSMMGELAASLSHEITQPIASARNNARAAQNFLDMQPPDLGEAREALSCVVGDTDRAGNIIDRIRDNIKKASPRKCSFDLNKAIDEVIGLARSAIITNGVSVRTRLAEGLLPIQGDRVQLQQVVLNLILNAVEAMSTVEAEPRGLLISTEQIRTGGILVSVRDSGPGIDADHLDRVFEAFYTTKSSGVGMGLSICQSIIDAHGGRLWAEANEPRGASFRFTIPGAENS